MDMAMRGAGPWSPESRARSWGVRTIFIDASVSEWWVVGRWGGAPFGVYDDNLESRGNRLAFAGLSVFFLSTAFLWMRLDRTPPSWDDAYYLTNSLVMYDALAESGLRGYATQFVHLMASKPPLIAALPAPVYLISGRKPRAAYVVNLVWLLVTFSALYWLGKRYANPRAGLLAVYIAGTMPMLYGLARWFLVECGLTAIVCVTICLAAEWNEFDGAWKACLLGLTCGLGLLMKMSFPVYVFIPLLYFAVRARRPALRVNTLLAFAVSAAVLAFPWYFVNYYRVLDTAIRAGSAGTAKIYGTGGIFSLRAILAYLTNLSNAGPALYFIAAAVLIFAIERKVAPRGRRGLLLCALWGAPVFFLVFGHYRDMRYAAPLFPALALGLAILTDAALERLAAKGLVVTCALLALPLVSMLDTSFGLFGGRGFDMHGLLFSAPRLDYARRYNPLAWPQREILQDLYRASKFAGGERTLVLLGTDSQRFNADNFTLAAVQDRLPFRIATTAYETDPSALRQMLESSAYFVYREGGEPEASGFNTLRGAALREVRESGRFVELPASRALPDGGVARVFENLALGR